MAHTLAAVFDQRDVAEQARQKLISAGYGSERIRLNDASSDYSGTPSTSGSGTLAGHEDDGVVASIKHFFSNLFGSNDDRDVYAEAVSRGHVVLTLEGATDAEIDHATDIMEDFSPLNIEEHSEQWRAGGWRGETGSLTSGNYSTGNTGASMQSQAGNLSQQHTPLGMGAELGMGTQAGSLSGGAQQSLSASQQLASDAALAAGSVARASNVRSYSSGLQQGGYDDEQYYRNHWNSTYQATGSRFEDYDPAYRYGSSMASSDTYRGRPWDEVEADLRSNWEHTYPQSTWENFKSAVRHGWDKLTH